MTPKIRWFSCLDMLPLAHPAKTVRCPVADTQICVCFQVATKEATESLGYKAFKTSKLTFIQFKESESQDE